MEVNPANIQQLAVYLQQTMSPQAEVRKPAEEFLQSVECNLNYPVLLLSLLNQEAGDANIKVGKCSYSPDPHETSFLEFVKEYLSLL